MAAAKTLQEQLAAAKQRVADLEVKVAAEANAPRPEVGAEVGFLYGRGENRKTYSGKIIAVSEDGKRVRIQYGEGFDTDVATVAAGELVAAPNKEIATGAAAIPGTGPSTAPDAAAQAAAAATAEAADPKLAVGDAAAPQAGGVAGSTQDGIPL